MKTVLVSGMFNVLHPGHVRLLRFASECGDHLIVAVKSDKTSAQSSHVNEQLRLEGVQSNTYVDESFLTDDDAVDLVRALKPDVLVKGADWSGKEIAGAEFVKNFGGDVVLLEFNYQTSTTDIINKILVNRPETFD